jgi:heptosyltransferase-2
VELLGILRSIRAARYDLCVADVTQTAALYGAVALLTGAPRRIGFDVANRGFLYTTRLPRSDQQNYIDCNLAIARALGAGSATPVVECFFDEADRESIDELLSSEGVRPPIIAMHAASNWQAKLWFRERWASLADALAERHGASILFVGSNREREYIEGIVARMRERAYSAVGRTSLAQLGALISRCSLFIGTDSGPRHIAAGVGCPQVTLMSSQDRPERWQFGHANEVVLRTDPKCSPCFQTYCWHRRCMSDITETMALEACASLLAVPMAPTHANAAL